MPETRAEGDRAGQKGASERPKLNQLVHSDRGGQSPALKSRLGWAGDLRQDLESKHVGKG